MRRSLIPDKISLSKSWWIQKVRYLQITWLVKRIQFNNGLYLLKDILQECQEVLFSSVLPQGLLYSLKDALEYMYKIMIKTLLCNANKHKLGNRTKPGWKFLLCSASPSCSSPLDPPTRMSAWRGVLSTDSTPEDQVTYRSKLSTKYLILGTSLLVELATTRPIPLTTVSVERYVSQVDVWWTACRERRDRLGVAWIEYHRDYKAWINLDRDTTCSLECGSTELESFGLGPAGSEWRSENKWWP